MAYLALQLQSGELFAMKDYLLAAAVAGIAGLAGLRIAARLFGRESILTRWR